MSTNNNDNHIDDSQPATGHAGGPRPSAAGVPYRFSKGSTEMALPLLKSRLAARPADPQLLLAIARASLQAAQWDDALVHARQLDVLQPCPEALALIADCLYHLGDREATEQLLPVIAARGNDEARGLIALHLIKDRQFARGFALRSALRENRRAAHHPVGRRSDIAWWDGKPFNGTLLVIAEQALGEEILNSGTLGELIAAGQHAVVECDPRLIPLFRRSFPALQFVPRFTDELAGIATPDSRKTTASELALFFRHCDDFSNPPRWLRADPALQAAFCQRYRQQRPGAALIGISWRSFRPVWGADRKTVRLTHLQRTLRTPGCEFLSLQYGPVTDDLAAAEAAGLPVPAIDRSFDPVRDIDTLAAQVSAMDIVVTTSNSTAHLAGALGVPTLLMLPGTRGVFPYWCYDGEQTPWYPSMRIVRGHDDAPDVFDARIAARLSGMIAALPATGGAA
ncbi:MAG: hypothetical protein ACOY33_05025 [Pseudomonadota bacterium]